MGEPEEEFSGNVDWHTSKPTVDYEIVNGTWYYFKDDPQKCVEISATKVPNAFVCMFVGNQVGSKFVMRVQQLNHERSIIMVERGFVKLGHWLEQKKREIHPTNMRHWSDNITDDIKTIFSSISLGLIDYNAQGLCHGLIDTRTVLVKLGSSNQVTTARLLPLQSDDGITFWDDIMSLKNLIELVIKFGVDRSVLNVIGGLPSFRDGLDEELACFLSFLKYVDEHPANLRDKLYLPFLLYHPYFWTTTDRWNFIFKYIESVQLGTVPPHFGHILCSVCSNIPWSIRQPIGSCNVKWVPFIPLHDTFLEVFRHGVRGHLRVLYPDALVQAGQTNYRSEESIMVFSYNYLEHHNEQVERHLKRGVNPASNPAVLRLTSKEDIALMLKEVFTNLYSKTHFAICLNSSRTNESVVRGYLQSVQNRRMNST